MTSSTSNDLRWRLGNLTAMLLLAAGIAWTTYLHFGPLALHVSGRLVEQGSGAPIEGAWVMLALTGSGPRSFWQNHGGCMSDSAVVRTDRDGRFRYTAEISADERSPSQGFTIFAYHPVFTAALRDDALDGASESLKQHVATHGYESLPGRTYLTLPRGYKEDDGEVLIEMSRRETTEWEALRTTTHDANLACLGYGINNGHREFYEETYRRGIEIACRADAGDRPMPFPIHDLITFLESRLYEITRIDRADLPENESYQRSQDRRYFVASQLLPEHPWEKYQDDPAPAVPPDDQEKLCGFYSNPIDYLVEKEFIP